MAKIRVLVVDDSAFMRKIIPDILRESPDIDIVGTAKNGIDALEKLRTTDIDVVTMDLEMPEMDGLTTLKKIMADSPLPVVMISAYTKAGVEETFRCLEAGAADFVTKPDGAISLELKKSADEIIRKVIAASKVNIGTLKRAATQRKEAPTPQAHREAPALSDRIVVIGSSTGGPQTLERIIPTLPKNLPTPVLVVQHMPPGFTKSLSERLDKMSAVRVKEAAENDVIEKGHVYLAPGDYHMEIKREYENGKAIDRITVNQGPKEESVRPCVNITMRSVAKIYGKKTIGVVLTGMGADGTDGLRVIKSLGGKTISQDKDTSIIYGMPKSAYEAGVVDYVVAVDGVSEKIVDCIRET